MQLRKLIAFAASATMIVAMAVGISAPAGAQDYHHGGGYSHSFHGGTGYHNGYNGAHHAFVGGGYHGGYHGSYNGGYHRAFVGGYGGGYNHPYSTGWRPGPGYTHYSWAWYRRHPAYWRAAHPYHGSPSLGIWIRL